MSKKRSFAWGYSLAVHSLITFIFAGGVGTFSANVIVPEYVSKSGLSTATLLNANTIGSLCLVPAAYLASKAVLRWGARAVTVVSLLIAGIFGCMGYGWTNSFAGYLICTICAQAMVAGYNQGTTNTLLATWFPKKRGIVMGFSSLGMPLSSIVFLPFFSYLLPRVGFQSTVMLAGAIMVAFAVVSWFWVRNTPQEVGLYPDNDPSWAASEDNGQQEKGSARELLKNPQFWMISISFGLFSMVTSAYMSQVVPFLNEMGMNSGAAMKVITLLTVCSIIASLISGVLDTKFGTKKATVFYAVWTIVAFAFFLFGRGNRVSLVISVLMMCGLSGCTANLQPSLLVAVFGSKRFAYVFGLVNPINMIIRSFGFAVLGTGLSLFGSYYYAYSVLLVFVIIASVMTLFIKTNAGTEHTG